MLEGITPGIGVTYHPENGWGGSIGLGNTTSNVSIAFSKEGNTTLQGSYSIGHGVQLAGDYTTNGAANIGFNYNPTGEGPRRDWNFSLMYDMAGTGLSASVGYTNPNSTIGLTSTVNRDGLSTSAELTGVSIATNGPDGFQMDEINFAEQNINAAQDQTQNDQNKAKLLASGDFTPADIANMSDDDIQNALDGLPQDEGVISNLLSEIGDYISPNLSGILAVGGGIATGIGLLTQFGSLGGGNRIPTNLGSLVESLRNFRRREDESTSTSDGGNRVSKLLDGVNLNWDLPNLGLSPDLLNELGKILNQEGYTSPTAQSNAGSGIVNFLKRIMFIPAVGYPVSSGNTKDRVVDTQEKPKPGEKLPPPKEPKSEDYQEMKTKVLDRFFGKDGSTIPAKVYLEELLKDSNLSPADKNYLRGYTQSLYKDIKSYATLKKDYENGKIPDNYKPKSTFAPLVPNVQNVTMIEAAGEIPPGGRDVMIGTVTGFREYNIDLDRKDLEDRVDSMNEHNKLHPNYHSSDIQIDKAKGVGVDSNVRYNILKEGKDANGNTLWTVYSFHDADNIHQFTNRETAELFVNSALKWREYQIKNGIQPVVPLRINDLSMPGVGNSPYVSPLDTSLDPKGHHHYASAIDIAFPGSDGDRAINVSESSNYDREKVKDLIKIMAESVPPGYELVVHIEDKAVKEYFSGTEIYVDMEKPHADHLHFQLRKKN
ncbi:hypothetical protein EHQ43_01400 [Leptospira bouyouniensis]|uniref:TIGR04388 family protein n=1 Tax=Leptospira bouyouniensis TaxID=2484911 RepID=A0A7I0HWF1_9LEPT|nr:hypothetical protein [Leptospira bouyouniensis]TGL09141.1 hypothetical protein EHQ43_01400 [Leptospira bouyouniensis]